jgi:2-dehydro-3-deoxy-D-arabinonate dehydratase
MMTALYRIRLGDGVRLARGTVHGGPAELLPVETELDRLLAAGAPALRRALDATDGPAPTAAQVLVPVAGQEVWAAGVTFERSRVARNEESGRVDHYDKVYDAARPELFPKAAPGRTRGPGEAIGIRADSGWNVPEPELGLVADAAGELVAYTVGDDVSSRSIEGENPLYLPQAKVYTGSCALGPALVPVEDAPPRAELRILLTVRREGTELYSDAVPLSGMRRRPDELLRWLFAAMDFPVGVVLLSGTSIVPPADFTLMPGDEVEVHVPGIGTLSNPVRRVGRPAPAEPEAAS